MQDPCNNSLLSSFKCSSLFIFNLLQCSGLGILAEMAMTKYKEETRKTDVDKMFQAELSPTPKKKHGFKNLDEDDDADNEFGSRGESGIASQEEESDSDEDRDDGKIHFRYDEYQQLQEIEMMQQQNE